MDKALENEIKMYMAARIAEGISLSDIQMEVNEKFSQKLTYMDIRILASALDIDWQGRADKAKVEAEKEKEQAEAENSIAAERTKARNLPFFILSPFLRRHT